MQIEEAKRQAKVLKDFLNRDGLEIPLGRALDAVAVMRGARDWNVLSATLAESSLQVVQETAKETSSKELPYLDNPLDIHELLQTRRYCMYVNPLPYGNGQYRPSYVFERVAGHYPTNWDWGTDLKHAEETAMKMNQERYGLTEDEAFIIVGSSMGAQNHFKSQFSARFVTDDHEFEFEFEAGEWLKKLPVEEFVKLAYEGWGKCETADEAALWARDNEDEQVVEAFNYLHALQRRKSIGFEVYFDEEALKEWIQAYRSDVYEALQDKELMD